MPQKNQWIETIERKKEQREQAERIRRENNERNAVATTKIVKEKGKEKGKVFHGTEGTSLIGWYLI